jgi:hypothetical protein
MTDSLHLPLVRFRFDRSSFAVLNTFIYPIGAPGRAFLRTSVLYQGSQTTVTICSLLDNNGECF